MKKLKFLTLAAIAAATAMVSSCSDNGDLSTPTKEAEGKALVVNPTVDGSRIVTTASDHFTSFKLFGFQNPPSTQPLFFNGTDGYVYNGAIGSAWSPTVTGAKWPANSDTNSSNFYALSVNGGSSLPAYTGVDLTNIQQGKFSYTAPTTAGGDVDLSKQEDILVAKSLNALQSDNNGVLNLPFTHAFAKITFDFRLNSYELNNQGLPATTGNLKDSYIYYIKTLTIHNVKLNGDYVYSSSSEDIGWSATGDLGDITYTFPTGFKVLPQHIVSSETSKYQELIGQDNSILVVPQSFTSFWTPSESSPLTAAGDAPYIEIEGWLLNPDKTVEALVEDCQMDESEARTFVNTYTPEYVWSHPSDVLYTDVDETEWTGEDLIMEYSFQIATGEGAPEKVYFPFPSALSSFNENKYYNIRLNIYKGVYDTGALALRASGIQD